MLAVRAHRCRRIASALILVLALSACTDDEPAAMQLPAEEPEETPSPALGRDVVVILPPTGRADQAFLDDVRAQLRDADEVLGDRVDSVATHVPASTAFIGDLAQSFAERGIAVVCVIGPDAVEQLRPLVARFPAVEFCAIDGRPVGENDPEGLRRVVLRTEELGHAVGVAARLELGDDGIVGLVLGAEGSGSGRFRAGLLAGLGDIEVVEADVPAGVDATPTERLEAVLAAGATQIIVDRSPGMTAAVAAIDGRAAVLGPQEILEAAGLSIDAVGTGTTPIVADWRFQWPRTLVGPVGALGDDGGRSRSLGLVALATMRLGPSTSAATAQQLRFVRAAFGRGQRDPLEPTVDVPPTGEGPGTPDPAEDPADGSADATDEPADPPAVTPGGPPGGPADPPAVPPGGPPVDAPTDGRADAAGEPDTGPD